MDSELQRQVTMSLSPATAAGLADRWLLHVTHWSDALRDLRFGVVIDPTCRYSGEFGAASEKVAIFHSLAVEEARGAVLPWQSRSRLREASRQGLVQSHALMHMAGASAVPGAGRLALFASCFGSL